MGHNYVAHLCFPQNVLCVWPNLVEFEGNKIFPIGGKKYSTAKIMYISPGVYFCLSNVSIVSFVMYPSALSSFLVEWKNTSNIHYEKCLNLFLLNQAFFIYY